MFNWYDTLYNYYKLGFYSPEDLDVFVASKWITEEEKTAIIGG